MNETINLMKTRRSMKNYNDRKIADRDLDIILEAGTFAASGHNAQAALMVVFKDKKTVALLSRLNAATRNTNHDPFYGAQTVVAVLADSTIYTHVEDGSLVMGNLMLAAHSLKIGSCWIHRAKQTFEFPEGRAILRKMNIDDKYVGVAFCILGYSDKQDPVAPPRKEHYIIRE